MPDFMVTSPEGQKFKVSVPDQAQEAREAAASKLSFGVQHSAAPRPTPEVPHDYQTWGNLAQATAERYPHLPEKITDLPQWVRDNPETVAGMGIPGTLKLEQAFKTGVNDYGFHVLNEQGKRVGKMTAQWKPHRNEVYISGLETDLPTTVPGTAAAEANRSAHALGPREIRSLVREIQRTFPKARGITALRSSGARHGPAAAGEQPWPLARLDIGASLEPGAGSSLR